MSDPLQPAPSNPGWPTNTAAGMPQPSGMALPSLARQRRGDFKAAGILTGLMLLGLAIILFLSLTRWIRTPWETFPPNTSQAGVHLTYGVNLLVGVWVAAPIAVFVIIMGHVALYLLRRIPRTRPEPERRGAGRATMTVVLVVCLITAYLALAMQIYYAVTYNPNY